MEKKWKLSFYEAGYDRDWDRDREIKKTKIKASMKFKDKKNFLAKLLIWLSSFYFHLDQHQLRENTFFPNKKNNTGKQVMHSVTGNILTISP